MSVPHQVEQLVERFHRNRDAYLRGQYNEAMVRGEYIDPFFIALGWDVHNTAGYAEAYKDVIHEDAIKVGGVTKAPDYCFRIGPTRKFFVEAKRPAVNIHDDVAPAYQLRRYAWSANLPLSILTDFEEFAVYDCRTRPKQADRPSTGRTVYTTFDKYPDQWDEIAAIFSKEAVLQGSFDKYAAGKGKRGTAQVDAEFLKEIEAWRETLARNIALRNAGLSVRDLNFAVQRTIDRIIFLRMCEDRGVEKQATLQALINGVNIYARLQDLFRQADERYNSGLFHFHDEPGRGEPPDTLTPDLTVDDKVLKNIFQALYYPASPYEFSVLPADILGNVYEQFLGKVIHLTAGHRAKVEEKPEVKKAGGVYYTPKYIVDYIVQHTVGKLLHGQAPAGDNCQLSTVNCQLALSPQKIGGLTDTYRPSKTRRPLRILDPACGSGSFLIGAYRYLLDYHRDWYLAHDVESHQQAGRIYQAGGKQWHLATDEKKRILLTNIFGVDIDTQAVEVTKLNLLLAVLENETNESLQRQLALFHERALPDLSDNIKCGNSLIATDFYAGKQLALFDEDTQYKINAFDWQDEFPEVFSRDGGDDPGFDAVIGNPPYLISAGQEYPQYFGHKYALSQYQTDFYVYFIERSLGLTRTLGLLSFIVSDAWLNSQYFSRVREHLLTQHRLDEVVVFDYAVFKKATMENSIILATRDAMPSRIRVVRFSSPAEHSVANQIDPADVVRLGLLDPHYSPAAERITRKIETGSVPLSRLVRMNRGMHAYRTDGYGQSKYGRGPQTKKDKETRSYHAEEPLDDTYLPELRGKHVFRFYYESSGQFVSYGPWLAEARTPEYFYGPKVALRKVLGPKLSGTFIAEPAGLDQSLYILISADDDDALLKHVLGVLVSQVGAWYIRTKHSIYDKLYPWYTKKQLASFPMKTADQRIVGLVERMLSLHSRRGAAKTAHAKTLLERQIKATDRQIDQLVYGLYGLTQEEIRIVEDATQ